MSAKIKTSAPETWPIADITPYELNVKKHEKEQVARIVQSITRFGWRGNPIIVDVNGVIIAGHGRRLAAIEMGLKEVPVVVARDLTPEQVRALRLSDNRAALSDIDTDMLKIELADLGDLSLLDGIFDTKELDFIGADLGEMNPAAFVHDMDVVIADQKTDVDARTAAAGAARVPLHKAFGFKDIGADSQIHITRLMSKAEAVTGLSGAEALSVFAAAL